MRGPTRVALEFSSRLTALDRAQRDQKRLAEVLACEVGFLVRIHYVEHLRLLLIIKQAKTTTLVKFNSYEFSLQTNESMIHPPL